MSEYRYIQKTARDKINAGKGWHLLSIDSSTEQFYGDEGFWTDIQSWRRLPRPTGSRTTLQAIHRYPELIAIRRRKPVPPEIRYGYREDGSIVVCNTGKTIVPEGERIQPGDLGFTSKGYWEPCNHLVGMRAHIHSMPNGIKWLAFARLSLTRPTQESITTTPSPFAAGVAQPAVKPGPYTHTWVQHCAKCGETRELNPFVQAVASYDADLKVPPSKELLESAKAIIGQAGFLPSDYHSHAGPCRCSMCGLWLYGDFRKWGADVGKGTKI